MTREEEARLIQRVRKGDADAFEPLMREHQTMVYNLALRLLKNETDAWDASQEAFLKAYTSLGDFRGESRFSGWLYRLTSNICIDMLRRQKRLAETSLQTEDEDGEELTLSIPDERFSPEKIMEQHELRRAVQSALDELTDDCRTIIILREMGGLSYEELADTLHIEAGTVKSRLNRARKKLCAILMKNGNIYPDDASNQRGEV